MKLNLGKGVQLFYFSSLLVLTAVFSYGVYYLVEKDFFSSEEINNTFELNYLVDKLNKENPVAHIRKFVAQDRISDAANTLAELDGSLERLGGDSLDSKTSLNATIDKQKVILNKLLGYPSISSITSVLSSKITSFNSFVSTNGWRTLTRISKRVQARFSHSSLRSGNYYDYSKFNKTYQATMNDIRLMEKVTKGSVLSSKDKQSILLRLRSLSTEMNMLKKYLTDLGRYDSTHKSLDIKFQSWLKKITPEMTARKTAFEDISKNMAFFMVGVFTFILLVLCIGFVNYRSSKKNILKSFEKNIIEEIQDRIIPTIDTSETGIYGKEYEEKIAKFREYIHKRISLGSIFQETTPFGTLLLDSNLNLIWANDQIYDTWGLSESKLNDLITWDYLQMSTNLGEDDPVQMALNQGIAGIYQIQIKRDGMEESLPFELYVSPVEYANQKRIMLFLYPLRSLEETLSNQTRSIVSPVLRTLEALTHNTFTDKKKEGLASDFEAAGIKEVFQRFEVFSSLMNQQRHSLLTEIDDLEKLLYDKLKLIDDIQVFKSGLVEHNNNAVDSLKNIKTSIIQNIDLRYEIESDYGELLKLSKYLTKENEYLIRHSEKAQDLIDENNLAFEGVAQIKDRFKKLKNNLADYRQRLGQSVEQTMIFTKMESSSRLDLRKLVDSLTKIKIEMKGFETSLMEFTKVTQDLDVGLAKLSMTFEGKEAPDVSEYRVRLKDNLKKIEEINFALENNSRTGEKSDTHLVSSISTLYHAINNESNMISGIDELISQSREDHSNSEDTHISNLSSNA